MNEIFYILFGTRYVESSVYFTLRALPVQMSPIPSGQWPHVASASCGTSAAPEAKQDGISCDSKGHYS